MFTSVGVAASAGVATALIVGVSIVPTMLVQWRGSPWRHVKPTENFVPQERQNDQKV